MSIAVVNGRLAPGTISLLDLLNLTSNASSCGGERENPHIMASKRAGNCLPWCGILGKITSLACLFRELILRTNSEIEI